MSLSSLLDSSVTLQRRTVSQDSSLGARDAWSDVATYPASVQPVSSRERMYLAQRNVFLSHKIYFDRDVGATPSDRLYQPSTGKHFAVRGFHNQGGKDRVWMAEAVEQMRQ